jgi:hypothetical protein
LENKFLRVAVSVAENTWELIDKRAQVSWSNTSSRAPWVARVHAGMPADGRLPLALRAVKEGGHALRCQLASADGALRLELVLRLQCEALQAYLVPEKGEPLPDVELFASGLEAGSTEGGEALVPSRMGLLLPAAGEAPFELHLGTYDYEGVHLAMAGLFKGGAALMATWHDPYLALNVAREMVPEGGRLRLSFTLSKTARSLQLHCLGRGDLTTLAAAYRQRLEALGYRVAWKEKLAARPQAERLFGACNVKLWTALARHIDEDLMERAVEVHWTFDEVAQVAEHLRNDLQLQDVLFHLGGWTRYGYDCRHPDIMPANPECGGNAGLADCVQRVKACGYLFCLHDNYQDIYRDSPSWDEALLERDADGAPHMGGVWLGGQAYYTCAREALRLAQRPQNLPLVRDTFHPDLYFIDTTYAAGPQECYDPRHPLTKQEDIHWKQALSDYAREVFGLFGSECGREWAVPHADFFEGLASVSGRYYHMLQPEALGGKAVPFFDMVLRDCIAIHGKYDYKPEEMGEQVIHHVAMGRPLYYHSLGEHLYWQDPTSLQEAPFPAGPYDPAVFTRAHNGWAQGYCLWDRFMKNTQEVLGPLHKLTAQALIERYAFLDEARLVHRTTFSNGVTAVANGSAADYPVASALGGKVILPPYGFLVEAGPFIAFHARSFGGHRYSAPVLFSLTSVDGRPLCEAHKVRVYHGFGEAELAWRGTVARVQREEVL